MTCRIWCWLTLLCATQAPWAGGRAWSETPAVRDQGSVTVEASVDRSDVSIGDPIRYTVVVSAPAGLDVNMPVWKEQLGDFAISDFGRLPAATDAGRVHRADWYTVTIFRTGYHLLPAATVRYTDTDGETHEVSAEPVRVHVESLLAREPKATEIRDIKAPEELPLDWSRVGLAGVALAGLTLLGWMIYLWVKRAGGLERQRARAAHEVALEALRRLRARQLPATHEFDAYYVGLSGIVRSYLESGLQLRAPEMTSEEFLSTASRDPRLSSALRRLLADFLAQADLVKFARHRPSVEDSEGAYQAAWRLVEETRPRPAATRQTGARRAAA